MLEDPREGDVMKKRIVSVLLALSVLVSLLPAYAIAEKAPEPVPNGEALSPVAIVQTKGSSVSIFDVEELVNAVDESGTSVVTMMADVGASVQLVFPYSCTMDLNGHKIHTVEGTALRFLKAGTENSVTSLKNGVINSEMTGIRVDDGALNMENIAVVSRMGSAAVALYGVDPGYNDRNRISDCVLVGVRGSSFAFNNQEEPQTGCEITIEKSRLYAIREIGAPVFNAKHGDGTVVLGKGVEIYSCLSDHFAKKTNIAGEPVTEEPGWKTYPIPELGLSAVGAHYWHTPEMEEPVARVINGNRAVSVYNMHDEIFMGLISPDGTTVIELLRDHQSAGHGIYSPYSVTIHLNGNRLDSARNGIWVLDAGSVNPTTYISNGTVCALGASGIRIGGGSAEVDGVTALGTTSVGFGFQTTTGGDALLKNSTIVSKAGSAVSFHADQLDQSNSTITMENCTLITDSADPKPVLGSRASHHGAYILGKNLQMYTRSAEAFCLAGVAFDGEKTGRVSGSHSVPVSALNETYADLNMWVTLEQNETAIVLEPSLGGAVTIPANPAIKGQHVAVTALAEEGYEFHHLLVNGVRIDGLTFTAPDTDAVTVRGVFHKIITGLEIDPGAVSLDLNAGSISIQGNGDGTSSAIQNGITSTAPQFIVWQTNHSEPSANTISVTGGEVRLVLSNVKINSETSPVDLKEGASLKLHLLGENFLTGTGINSAGICVNEPSQLALGGTGSVTATAGRYGAGIGSVGRFYTHTVSAGSITITGGTITAIGGACGAGIGGGESGDGGNITITGGTVTANGSGAGIGGGESSGTDGGNGGNITILGGTVTATGGKYSAGIGGGEDGDGGSITILGGTVTATGGDYGAGIGGGDIGNSGKITIADGTVTAYGGRYSAGIGGGGGGGGGSITIAGGTVTAIGGDEGAGIGGSGTSTGGTVVVENATVTAHGYPCAIGGGSTDVSRGCIKLTVSNSNMFVSYTDPAGSNYIERIEKATIAALSVAKPGSRLSMEISASGASGLRYQWQRSPDGNTNWEDVPDGNASLVRIRVDMEHNGWYYRCRIVNGWNNVVYTECRQIYALAFSKQPVGGAVNEEGTFRLRAEAFYTSVSWKWEKSLDGGATYTRIPGEIGGTLVITAGEDSLNALYRCVITAHSESVYSDPVWVFDFAGGPSYREIHYLQDLNSGYTAVCYQQYEAEAGTEVSARVGNYPGFAENTAKSCPVGIVKEDGSLLLIRYYDRVAVTLNFEMEGAPALPPITALYGTPVTLPEITRCGYAFLGWFTDAACTIPAEMTTMPAQNVTLYAKCSAAEDAARGIEYRIEGIALRKSGSTGVLSAIPRGNFVAEVSITNLSSQYTDVVILAAYDVHGRMLDMTYLFATVAEGETATLGTLIKNTNDSVASVKAFVLSSLAGMKPLAESAEIGG